MINHLSRETLRHRHRLSHQQIDDILNEKTGKKYLPEKMAQLKKLSRFLDLTGELDKHNLWYVILKGPLLSQRIYNDPAARIWRDFDFLTKPELIDSFAKILRSMGFEYLKSNWPDTKNRQAMYLHFGKNIEMHHPETSVTVEIHWKMFTDRLTSPELEWKLITDHIEQAEFSGKRFNQFTNELELLYLVIHGSIHAWFRLKWLTDIQDIITRLQIDNDAFLELSKQMNAERFVCLCNQALAVYFPDCELLPCEITECSWLGNHTMNQISGDSDQSNMTFMETVKAIRFKMALSSYMRYKMDVLRLVTFNKQDLKYNWIPPYPVFFYLFRPFGILLRKLK